MKRPSFLAHHLGNLNRSRKQGEQKARSRFYFLFPIACASLGFATGYVFCAERALKHVYHHTKPYLVPLEEKPPTGHPGANAGPSWGVQREWRGRTRAGEPVGENQKGLTFVW